MKPNFFTTTNYPVDPVLDYLLSECVKSGIKSIKDTYWYLSVDFNNGKSAVDMWNTNKYYAWLSKGRIGDYAWKDARPKKSTMRKLIRAMEEHYKNGKND